MRTERDSNGDGVIDQWWEYPKPGCPLIHADMNNDGRPDPGATIDYCKETGYVPPDRADKAPVSPTFETKTLAADRNRKQGLRTCRPRSRRPRRAAPAEKGTSK